jgi:adenylate cyclase
MPSNRRLAAIMFSDIAGYTAMMQHDEADGLRRVRHYRQALEGLVKEYGGEVVQHYGDGSLSIFASAVEAVHCAKALQLSLKEDPSVPLRIGLHVGDIAREGEYLYGDGVNLASRVEALAIPGAVLLTERVMYDIKNHAEFEMAPLGAFQFKNVREPMEVFALADEGLRVPNAREVRRRLHATTAVDDKQKSLQGRWWRWPVILVLLTTLSAAVWMLWKGGQPSPEDVGDLAFGKSIAVLPFEDLSPQRDQAYFGDGIAEEILNALGKVESLQVAGRTSSFSFKGKAVDIPEIGRQLGVSTVLEGSVRKAGDQVRITAQLINAENGYHLWSEEYDRQMDSIFAIQEEIAQAVVEQLKEILMIGVPTPQVHAATQSQEAYEQYLRGKYMLSQRADGAKQAVVFFERAIELDSLFAEAHAGLGRAYLWLGWGGYLPSAKAFPEARRHAQRALEINEDLAFAHAITGSVRLWYDWDWAGARQALEKAVAINPSEAGAHLDLGWLHVISGHFGEAQQRIERALELDPLNLEYNIDRADFYRLARRYDEALDLSRSIRQLYPDNSETRWIMGMIHYQLENYDQAEALFREAAEMSGQQSWARVHLAMALARTGHERSARQILEDIRRDPARVASVAVEIAMGYLALDEKQAALNLLEKAYEMHANWLISLKVDPVWDELRDDPRFQLLQQQMAFPE